MPDDYADDLARRIAAMPDPSLRTSYVGAALRSLDADRAAVLLLVVQARADVREPQATLLWLAASVALLAPDMEATRRAIAAAAALRRAERLERSLESAPRALSEDQTGQEHQVPDYGRGRPLALGERKSLARRPTRQVLARVLRDPHPDVIRLLLGNPALTEGDVVQLVARRPVRPEVLLEVALSPRWMERHRVRVALVRNPCTPSHVGVALCRGLLTQELREIAESSELDDTVRGCARHLLGLPEELAAVTYH